MSGLTTAILITVNSAVYKKNEIHKGKCPPGAVGFLRKSVGMYQVGIDRNYVEHSY